MLMFLSFASSEIKKKGEKKMSKNKLLIAATLMVLFLLSLYPMLNVPAQAQPRRDIELTWYADVSSAFSALQAGTIDVVAFNSWSDALPLQEGQQLSKNLKQVAESDPNLQIAQYTGNDMAEFDLNNNLTIMDYPTSRNPMSVEEVRKAIAYLVDKDYIIANIKQYYGSRIDAPVCYPQTEGWVAAPGDPSGIPSVVTHDWNHNGIIEPSEDNYPWKYNPDKAAEILANLCFSDTDQNGYLNYPNDAQVWGDAAGIDTTQMPLKICIRAIPEKTAAGLYLCSQLEGSPAIAGDSVLALSPWWAVHGKVGGDFDTTDNTWVQPRQVLSPIVKGDRNYHIYTGDWSLPRYPTYLFNLFHSMFWYPYGPNYVTDHAHPEEDLILEDIWYAANFNDAQLASKNYTYQHIIHCKNIPLWSTTSYCVWRKELVGIVNMRGYGPVNKYTLLNAYRATNPSAPIRIGVPNSWDRLNPLYSEWIYEHTLLDTVCPSLINVNPYDLAMDIPWVAQDWEVGTWIDPRDGLTKSTVTYWLRKDVGCAAPVTGDFAGFFDAEDYEFSAWYTYQHDDSWEWRNFMDVNHLEIIDCNTVKVYFDDQSMWFLYAPTHPLLGPKQIMVELLCDPTCVTFSGTDLVEDPTGYFEYKMPGPNVVQVINATCNGIPIEEGVDFYIRAGYDTFCHNVFVPLRPFLPMDVITICYYTGIPYGGAGTYLGGVLGYTYAETMYSYGTHYPISIAAGGAALNKNPFFFLETPLLGEIDWRWTWEGTVKPRGGYFSITILDVVKCTGSYCARGDGAFNPVYIPGADIDSSDLCHVGILDLVTITGKYALRFGHPPSATFGLVGGSSAEWIWNELIGGDSVSYTSSNLNLVFTPATGKVNATKIADPPKFGWARGKWHKPTCQWEYFKIVISDPLIPVPPPPPPRPPKIMSYERIQLNGGATLKATLPCLKNGDSFTIIGKKGATATVDPVTGRVTASDSDGGYGQVKIIYHKPDCRWEKLKITFN